MKTEDNMSQNHTMQTIMDQSDDGLTDEQRDL
jgi:hypothetical protein